MKKSLLLLSSALTLLAGSISAQTYSNASWDGPWLLTGVTQNYVTFDGAGTITSAGVPGVTGAGDYSVQSNGAVSGNLYYSGTLLPYSGSFSNDSTVTISVSTMFGSIPATFLKVKNQAVMAGTYDGTVTQTSGGSATQTVNFTVDANGAITGSTNLTGPVSGHLFYSNGKVSGLLKSGEAAPFTEIQFTITSAYAGGNSVTGSGTLTGNKNASFSLTKSSTTGVSNVNASAFRAYPNPVQDNLILEGKINGTVKIYDILGNEVMSTSANGSKTVLNLSNLSKGVYFYSVSGSNVQQGKFIVE
ncbi:MAG: T9SS type A sorting domain-containing protein [Flavobacteriales bacterium]